MAEDYSDEQ